MVQLQQPEGPSFDGPKRSRHFFRDIGKKKLIYIVLPLLLINAGVAHMVTKQVAIRASGAETEVKDDSATLPAVDEEVSMDTQEEALSEDIPVITTYIVKQGDTLSGIAEKFGISINTIRWANDLTEKTSKIKPGDDLVILPVSGIEYTVKKGDTLSGIVAKFDANQDDILKYNDIEANAITVGTKLIIPGAEPIKAPAPKQPSKVAKPTPTQAKQTATPTAKVSTAQQPESKEDTDDVPEKPERGYAVPVSGVLTQGIHDRNAVDFGVPVGTPVKAFKSGTVLVAKSTGYNGGYGAYIVINHEGTCQTQYSHLSSVSVSVGDTVSQGETIGLSGNTGRSTGPHLHFNVRNCGGNPFAKYKIGTRF